MNEKILSEDIPVVFEVKKVRFPPNESGWSVLEVKFKKYPSDYLPAQQIIVVGYFVSVFEEDEFEGEGHWINHKTWGYQFVMNYTKRIVPQSRKGMKAFIQRFVKGIGAKTAKNIVDTYGDETLQKIEEDWHNLLRVPGIGEKKARKIHERIKTHKKFENVAMFVLSNGGGYRTALKIYEEYGDVAIMKIRANPYCLASIPKLSFNVADQFAKNLKIPFDDMERTKSGILYFIDSCMRQRGDIFVYKQFLLDKIQEFLKEKGAYKKEKLVPIISLNKINKALKELTEERKIIIEDIKDKGEGIYLSFYHYVENRIVSLIKRNLTENKPAIATPEEIEAYLDYLDTINAFPLGKEQRKAVLMALTNGMSIMTGFPGTGKTQTTNAIIQCIQHFIPGAVIHLAAPTGKAAKRMNELTHMIASTIHRLIKLNGFELENKTEPVEGDFLIVDEFSMVDAYVLYKLLEALERNVRVLFVGDFEQLPSVGVGLILRDLIDSQRIPTTRLTEIFRQSEEGQIVLNSHKLIKGKKSKDSDGLEFNQPNSGFYFIKRKTTQEITNTMIESIKRLITKQGYNLSDIQVLSPIKKGDLGVYNLNRILQDTFNPPDLQKRQVRINELLLFREGDKVIQVTNDYALENQYNEKIEVFNGEVGTILSIEGDAMDLEMVIQFDDKTVVYSTTQAEDLMLAYCITVHRSQGSEFPIVLMPFHNSLEFGFTKNLIYTAWTRAKSIVTMVGSVDVLDKAIDRNDNTIRNSQIKEKLMRELPKISLQKSA